MFGKGPCRASTPIAHESVIVIFRESSATKKQAQPQMDTDKRRLNALKIGEVYLQQSGFSGKSK
ncbi:MAG: hypothetical protein R2851_03805 [Caldilineaceae bacterium]